jgi:beta-phosphoglucomutase-like phosphatase (HAD superfamily)
VAVEDSDHGVEAAVRAGMTAIGYRPDWNDQSLSVADTVVDGPEALRRELLERA